MNCNITLKESPRQVEFVIHAEGEDLPKEVVLCAVLVMAMNYADEKGMDIEKAFRDVLKYQTLDAIPGMVN